MQPISFLAGVATDNSFSNAKHTAQLIDRIAKAGAAVLVLIAITTISVYKPWGKIKFRFDNSNQRDVTYRKTKSWVFYLLTGLVILIILFIIMHVFGGGMESH